MHIRPKPPTVKGGPDRFHGDVWLDVIVLGEEPSRVRVSVVRFAPSARNAWHAHAVGRRRCMSPRVSGASVRAAARCWRIRAGDTIETPPGEWHWHGAAPDHFMTHLAIWEAPGAGVESEWAEHVSDVEYGGGEVGSQER